ncbi:MAG TPA: hypothetical protein VFD69_11825 [Vicinamibacterales bacterium]|nr:hypothetical protein [Vicinamibacterales bacterium]
MLNKVVARFSDGRMIKGSTSDFVPAKEFFHVASTDAAGSKPTLVQVKDLKAIFFVKDFAGRPDYQPKNEFEGERTPAGRKIRVVFADGEIIVGTTQGYQPGRPGFFMVPADQADNNIERCYVVTAATSEVTLL